MWEKRVEPNSGTAHVAKCFPKLDGLSSQGCMINATFDEICRENTGSKKLECFTFGNKFDTMFSSFPQACFSAVAARENAKIEDSHSAVVQVFSMSRFQIFKVIEVKRGQ